MSMSIGLPNAAAVTIGGKTTATVNALSEASEDALGERQVRADLRTETESKTEKSDSTQSIATKILLKRMQELQQQLRDQQQQLAAAQARPYATPEARTTAIMAIQGQIADTTGALQQVTGSLIKELVKESGSGALVNTTA
ncbi:hypothetical protein [Pseudomonas frederiksbergensis]|jgi:hypothetical protein|uniref:hypothetical protein n=1 Tax=Pseudomonas frederiksbergensis TaxID=104087 RepID=UPI002DBCE930|nr:hypothetical protein [Pseudomonas frederiksbergensis]WRV70240.1 hypothetical protein VQ575_09450 [Pseudomonas frederiksbergensis]